MGSKLRKSQGTIKEIHSHFQSISVFTCEERNTIWVLRQLCGDSKGICFFSKTSRHSFWCTLAFSYDKYCLREAGFISYYSEIVKPDNGFLVVLINTHTHTHRDEHIHTTPCLATKISIICCILELCKLGFQKEYFKSGLYLPQYLHVCLGTWTVWMC